MLEFSFNLLKNSKLQDLTSYMLFKSYYLFRLTIYSASQFKSSYNTVQLKERVNTMTLMQNDFLKEFKKLRNNMKKVQVTC